MDPRSGMTFELSGEGADPPVFGATMEADLAAKLLAGEDAEDATKRSRLAEMAAAGEPVVAVDEEVVQKLRLGEKELRRRRQRRR